MTTNPTRRRALSLAAACLLSFSAVLAAHASATFPTKPVRIIVPYPTGGFNDTLARVAASKLTAMWGQPVIVDNRPGAGTTIGTQAVAAAAPDGHTLLVAQFPLAANPWLYKKLPYDTQTAFAPVVLAGRSPMMVLSHAERPYQTLQAVLAKAKEQPGALNYGSSGPGSSQHLAMVLFERQSGTRMNEVPYRGSTPLLTDLAGGQVDLAIDLLPHALPFIQTGKVRPLAMATAERSPLMPELPTAAEQGVADFVVSGWHGFMVPAGTPAAVIERLNQDLNTVLAQDDVREIFRKQGVTPDGGSPAAFRDYIAEQMQLWQAVITEGGISID